MGGVTVSAMGTALVTGGTSGIGATFARQLADRGHDLVLVARDAARLEAVAADLRTRGVGVEVLAADRAVRADVQRVADRLADPARPVDLLVNNAGFGLGGRILDGDLAEHERAIDVMARAVLLLSVAAARAMRSRGRGAIVNVSSVAGFISMGSYSAVKSWVTVFSEGLAGELHGSGVTVTALCPGFVHTEFHQRAGVRMSKLPEQAWIDGETVVRQCLRDVAAARVVSVPTLRYRVLVALARSGPRPAVRRVSRAIVGMRSR